MITIRIDTDSAAFEDGFEAEIKGILLQAERSINIFQNYSTGLYDSNGNRVGYIEITEA